MEPKVFATVFVTIFIAELGDKTQLATLLFAAERSADRWTVFVAAASALIVATAIGVAVGAGLAQVVSPRHLSFVAGLGFIAIGVWILVTA